MFIPVGTDTPIYYWPFATGVMVLINILAFVGQLLAPETGFMEAPSWIGLALSHGDGLHPVQWLTSFFIHGGILHLLGNMIFLITFGLIVEGKIGPLMFSALYLGIGISQNIVEQLLFLPFETGPSLGASSAIYGIMMVALFWAPQDNLKCMFNIWIYIYFVNVPIFIFGLFYFLWDFSFALFSGFSMGTALLHVMGALTGVVPGIAFLLFGWVDGEKRDLISMFRELFGMKPLKKRKTQSEINQERRAKDTAKMNRQQMIARSWDSIDKHLRAGNVSAAGELYRKMQRLDSKVVWHENTLLRIINELQKQQDWDGVFEYSEEYLELFTSKTIEIRLNLARMFAIHKLSPRRALKQIQILNSAEMSDQQKKIARQIVRKSQEMIADGVMELGEE